MKPELKIVFATALAGLVLGAVVSDRAFRTLAASDQRVYHAYELLEQLHAVRINLTDAEAGQRGYLLTGREEHLQPYMTAALTLRHELDRLEVLATEPDQRDWLRQLRRVVETRFDALGHIIALRRDPGHGLAGAARAVEAGSGLELMSELRELTARAEREEMERLRVRIEESETAHRVAGRTLAAAAVSGIGLLGLVIVLARRHARNRDRVAAVLKEAHDLLESRVRDRTAELAAANDRLRAEVAERVRSEAALRASQEQLQQAQKMEAVGHLAGGVAHDFNNLLTVINGYSMLLLRDLPPGPTTEPLAEILGAGQRAATLTRQLLAFGRQQVLRPRVLDLNELVTGLSKMLARLIGEDVRLVLALAPALGRVTADPGQLEQVLLNLCVNARDAMPTGGRLTIETDDVEWGGLDGPVALPAGRYVRLAVTDTGCGMDAETQARIFEPFFTTKGVGQGTGLGLAMVFGIVTQSGGHVRVSSTVGAGSTFEVHLPVTGDASGHDAPEYCPPPPRGRETVLLVEDEGAVRALAARTLRGAGYTVLEANGSAEATRVAAGDGSVHLLLTDVVMPEVSGRELAERLVASRPELRVLFMSGYTSDAVLRHGVSAADVPFLQKPFSVDDLLVRVRHTLDAPWREPLATGH